MIITFLCALPHVKSITCYISSMQRPIIHPWAYSVLILLVTNCFTLLSLLSLLCHHYFCCRRYYHNTVATDKLLPSKYLSGAVELTTQLLKLINILLLPLCRIYKLGYSYPRRLLRSPTLVGHQDYFSALLPGSIAFIYKSTFKLFFFLRFIHYG